MPTSVGGGRMPTSVGGGAMPTSVGGRLRAGVTVAAFIKMSEAAAYRCFRLARRVRRVRPLPLPLLLRSARSVPRFLRTRSTA